MLCWWNFLQFSIVGWRASSLQWNSFNYWPVSIRLSSTSYPHVGLMTRLNIFYHKLFHISIQRVSRSEVSQTENRAGVIICNTGSQTSPQAAISLYAKKWRAIRTLCIQFDWCQTCQKWLLSPVTITQSSMKLHTQPEALTTIISCLATTWCPSIQVIHYCCQYIT